MPSRQTQILNAGLRRRTRERDAWIVSESSRLIDPITRRLEDRLLAIVNRNAGGQAGVLGSAAVAWMDYTERLAAAVEKFLRKFAAWSWESAAAAVVRALPMRFWIIRAAPIGTFVVPGFEQWGPPHRHWQHQQRRPIREDISWEIDYQRILSGETTDEEAREIVRQFEFPPPDAETVERILTQTTAPDGLSAMQRIRTVEASRIPDLQQLLVDAFSRADRAGMGASAVDFVGPLLRQLVGNDPGKSTGMNYRAKRIARTEGVRVAEAGLRDTWNQAGDLIGQIVWQSALVPLTRPDHAALHGKVFRQQPGGSFVADDGMVLPEIPYSGPETRAAANCLCWTSAELADDLTAGLPPENLGAWYDPAVLRAERAKAASERKRVASRRIAERCGGITEAAESTLCRLSKSEIAKSNAKRVAKEVQRYSEEHNEREFASQLGGESLDDNEPLDVRWNDGTQEHGIELKTLVDNKHNKITMKRSAMDRKAEWERKRGRVFHTVVIDDEGVIPGKTIGAKTRALQRYLETGDDSGFDFSKRQIYYRRGFGSFRTTNMYKVEGGTKELKQIMRQKKAKLPKGAK